MSSTGIKYDQGSLLEIDKISKNQLKLENLKTKLGTCTECSLCFTANRSSDPVHTGNLHHIDLMLVGEAPGKEEDKGGRPFIGQAGQLLQQILVEINFTKNLYVTNVVKHRPPKNRKPTIEEAKTCGTLFLEKEIALIKPKTIVCLGRAAAEYFLLQKFGVLPKGSLRGRSFLFNDITVFCTWHPAYILRQMNKKDELANDLLQIKNYLLERKHEQRQFV